MWTPCKQAIIIKAPSLMFRQQNLMTFLWMSRWKIALVLWFFFFNSFSMRSSLCTPIETYGGVIMPSSVLLMDPITASPSFAMLEKLHRNIYTITHSLYWIPGRGCEHTHLSSQWVKYVRCASVWKKNDSSRYLKHCRIEHKSMRTHQKH